MPYVFVVTRSIAYEDSEIQGVFNNYRAAYQYAMHVMSEYKMAHKSSEWKRVGDMAEWNCENVTVEIGKEPVYTTARVPISLESRRERQQEDVPE